MKIPENDITQHWHSFQRGLEEGFTFFFEKYYPSLCFFANRFVKNKEAAEDIVSEALMKVWEKRASIEEPKALKNYCYMAVRNACLRWLENKHHYNISSLPISESLYSEETVLHNIIKTEVVEELHAAIKQLPSKSSQVFAKLYIEGKSVAETAKELQLTVSTIKSHKRNGLFMLRNIITRVFQFLLIF